MNLFERRNIAIALIVLGLAALGFGLWILISMFFPGTLRSPLNLPGAGNQLTVTPGKKAEPKVISAPVVVQGTTTAQSAPIKTSDLREAINKATDMVSRMGSGSSQSGFLGYDDALLGATNNLQSQLKSERASMQAAHPANGPIYGVTTRVVSSKVTEGSEGSAKITVKLQAQRSEDAGARGVPTSVTYLEYTLTLARQADGTYLVDELKGSPVTP